MKGAPTVTAIDLFCGAGGLSLGLKQAGIRLAGGIDLDPACEYPYTKNLKAPFLLADVADITGDDLMQMWGDDPVHRLLAGCAPCQPFSSHRRGVDTRAEANWAMLTHFADLVEQSNPHYVTMENVARLRGTPVYAEFVSTLRRLDYAVDFAVLSGPSFGLPQQRRRLVLTASRVGVVRVPVGGVPSDKAPTVRDTIADLPPLQAGEADPNDPLHYARNLSELNLKRMKASKPGGTWRDWPEDLVAPCHRKASGSSFQAFYGRMEWDRPSPTITTMPFNFGTGRFGHPDQDRSLTLREAAMLQGFPRTYKFTPPTETPTMNSVGRLIGNAVPPLLGRIVGKAFLDKTRTAEQR